MIKPKTKDIKTPIVLLDTIPKLGRRGEVVHVSKGYARNYLVPYNKAMEVNKDNLYRIEFEKKKWFQQELKLKEELQDLAKKIKKTSVKIEMKANEEGHLFGSVNESMVSEAYKEKGFNLAPKTIDLTEVKKELGVFEIKVKLHPEITTTTKIHIIQSESQEKAESEAS